MHFLSHDPFTPKRLLISTII
ncbi:hypothetical protein [Lederbergia galactosidilytica]